MTLMPAGRLRLEGKVAVITGAGSSGPGLGTGKAASILFAREGARVLLVDRNPQAAEETLATIREEGGEASIIGADVTLAVDCQAIADAAVERYGALHICSTTWASPARGLPPTSKKASGTTCWSQPQEHVAQIGTIRWW